MNSSTKTALLPLQTPFWFSGLSSPSCPAQMLNDSLPTHYDASESEATYCCDGLLIDKTQSILGPLDGRRGDII
jgi:hypothetical protein